MPKVGDGRIEAGTGAVTFKNESLNTLVPLQTTQTAALAPTVIRSVTGRNIGDGQGIFAGTTGGENAILDFKTLLGGPGIDITTDATTVTLRATGSGGGASAFVDLTDGPGTIAAGAILMGSLSGTRLRFIDPPAGENLVLMWNGVGPVWSSTADTLQTIMARSGTSNVPLALTNTTDSTELGTGAFVTAGGASIAKTLRVGADLYVTGNLYANIRGNSETASKLATARNISLTGDVSASGVFDGSANLSLTTVLGNTGVSPGTYTKVTVNAQGRVTFASNISASDLPLTDTLATVTARGASTSAALTLSNTTDASAIGTGALVLAGGLSVQRTARFGGDVYVSGTLYANISGAAVSADKLTTARQINLTGPVTASGVFDGSSNLNLSTTISDTGVVPGTYTKMVVQSDGRIITGVPLLSSDIEPLLGSLTFDNLTVAGNLIIGGTFTAADFTSVTANNLVVDDTYLLLGGTIMPTMQDGRDRGIAYRYYDSAINAGKIGFFGLNANTRNWTFRTGMGEAVLDGGIFSAGTLGTIEANVSGASGTAQKLFPSRVFALSGDASGNVTSDLAGGLTLPVTLVNVVAAGTYSQVSVDAKGRVIAGANPAPAPTSIVLAGDITASGSTGASPINATLSTVGTPGTYERVVVDSKGRVISGTIAASQSISLAGDVTGNGLTSSTISVTLATVGSPGSYTSVVVDNKGRVVSGSNPPAPSGAITLSGDVTAAGVTGTAAIPVTLATVVGLSVGTYARVAVDTKGRVTAGFTTSAPVVIALSGDVQATGSSGATITATLANSGVAAGTYSQVVVDLKGRVTAGSNPGVSTNVFLGGDVSASGSTGATIGVTLAAVPGLVAGTYSTVVVDTKGRVTSGSNASGTDTLQDVAARGANVSVATINLTATTPSSSNSTGALVLSGGLGVGGNINTSLSSNVTLGGGATQNLRLWVNGNYGALISAMTFGATITPNFALANNFAVTLTGNSTMMTPANMVAGQSGVIFLTQDGAGNRTMSFAAGWRFPNGGAPNLTTAANVVDALVYTVRSSSQITAVLIPNV